MSAIRLLPQRPLVEPRILERVRRDYERLARGVVSRPIETYLAENYQLDVASEYAGIPLKNPWGKGSGQLSMTAAQVDEDVEAGLGFVVLKTVIAQDAAGTQSMRAWAVRESRMSARPIVGKSGEKGWTVFWKGRGWWHSFDDYLALVRDARRRCAGAGTLVAPSCKFHLPASCGEAWRAGEYQFTVGRLVDAWRSAGNPSDRMPLEKDFSPTLAGSDRAQNREMILSWLRTVPRLIRDAASSAAVCMGLKIFNALDDDAFQVDMLRTIHEMGDDRPDYFIYGNRLFDPLREYDGRLGIAYGGPDLSDRNLAVLGRFQQLREAGQIAGPAISCSGTGNITTGKTALEYALRGASSFQLHTFFQLPAEQYRRSSGSKTEKALHELYFHPESGFVVWMHHLAGALMLPSQPICFRDVVGRGLALSP